MSQGRDAWEIIPTSKVNVRHVEMGAPLFRWQTYPTIGLKDDPDHLSIIIIGTKIFAIEGRFSHVEHFNAHINCLKKLHFPIMKLDLSRLENHSK